MNVTLLNRPQVDSCICSSAVSFAELAVCSIADLYMVIERIRKDPRSSIIRAQLRGGKTRFQQLCDAGNIILLPLTSSALADEAFEDRHTEELELDKSVFGKLGPDQSIQALNLKEVTNTWGWEIISNG
jgi:hypothetical protein